MDMEQPTYLDGLKAGLDAAAKFLEDQPDNGVSFQTLWRLAREVRAIDPASVPSTPPEGGST